MPTSRQIAIVGAGIAGLTAAYFLQKKGFNVTVYEASDRVGGRMTTDSIDGYIIDRGAQFLSVDYDTLMPLIHEVGLASELVACSSWNSIVRRNKVRPLSPNHFFSPLTSGYLNFKEAYVFLRNLKRWEPILRTLPISDYTQWSTYDTESASEFMLREFGNTMLEYMLEPQMEGFYFQTPEEVSAIQALMLLNFALRKGNLMSLRHGIGSLSEKLGSLVNIKLHCPINAIDTDSSGKLMLTSTNEKFTADKVILATPATVARQLFKTPNAIEHQLLQTQYSSTLNISLGTDKAWRLPTRLRKVYGIIIPRKERQTIAAISIESNKNKNCAFEGELLQIMLDGKHGKELLHADEHQLLQIILPEIEKYLPGITNAIRFTHIVRWENAIPISFVGKSLLLKNYYDSITPDKNLILAGDYMNFPFTDSAALSGIRSTQYC